MRTRTRFSAALACGALLCSACETNPDEPPPAPVLQPVTGKVTVQGQPLAEAVVTFLQTDERGTTAVAETDESGQYVLTYLGEPGAAAATYKVAISYLEGPDGTVYGLGPRSSLSKPYGLFQARDRLPPEWSDLGKATRRVSVPEGGGVFDFNVEQPLLPPPPPSADAEKTSAAKAAPRPADAPDPGRMPTPVPGAP